MPACLHVYMPDSDAFYARAVRAGNISVMPSRNPPYGDRAARSKALRRPVTPPDSDCLCAHTFRFRALAGQVVEN